jgi:hypothetical protein
MKIHKSSLVLSLVLISLIGCKKPCDQQIDTSKIHINVEVERLEKDFIKVKTPQDATNFLTQHANYANFNLTAGIPPQELVKQVLWLSSQPFDMLLQDVEKQFGDFHVQKEDLTKLFKNTSYYYPTFVAPKVNTIVTGFSDYVLDDTDSLLLIGLDYFLDSTAHYQPQRERMPDYIKKYLQPNTIDIKTAYALSYRFIAPNLDQKLISQMIQYGKQYYFMRKVLPCKTEYELLDYSINEWAEIKSNEYLIYSFFTKNELFYSAKPEYGKLYIGDSPKCTNIGDKCPGRIGRWLGYEIVKAYAEKNEISLQALLLETDAVKIFSQAAYKPEKK